MSKRAPPPKFSDGMSYTAWVNKVDMWKALTDYPDAQKAIAVRLYSFEGNAKAEKAVELLKAADLTPTSDYANKGWDALFAKLDPVFKDEENDTMYLHYSRLNKLRKTENMSMVDYIVEFEQLNAKLAETTIIPDAILSFMLLDGACLSESEKKMALTLAKDIEFAKMKSAMKRLFSKAVGSDSGDFNNDNSSCLDSTSIKQEAFYSSRYEKNKYNKKGTSRKWNNSNQSHNRNWKNSSTANRKFNLKDKHGNISRCVVCDSKMHWASDCQHSKGWHQSVLYNENGQIMRCTICDSKMHKANECQHGKDYHQSVHYSQNDYESYESDSSHNENNDEFCNFVLLTNLPSEKVFLTETYGAAIVDTGCTKTVAGTSWLENYMGTLSENQQSKVEPLPSNTLFVFGDGRKVVPEKRVVVPVEIGGVHCPMEIEIVRNNIPLLLGQPSLIRAETVLDLGKQEAKMFGNPVKMEKSKSGHYYIDVTPGDLNMKTDMTALDYSIPKNVLFLEADLPKKERKAQITKLHKQFAHAKGGSLKKLIKSANINIDTELNKIIDNVILECGTCKLYKKPNARPVVGFSKSTDFNDTVSMDLHQISQNMWYLHMIDEFTRYSNAVIITDKKKAAQAFLIHWIKFFGRPNRIFSDNGGEFIGQEMHNLCNHFEI